MERFMIQGRRRRNAAKKATRVVMKKKVHKKTVVRDGKEETIVTTDTHVEHEDRGPEDIQAAMKEIIDNFVEGTGEFSSEPKQDK